MPEFGKNPFVENNDDSFERNERKKRISQEKASEDFLKENYKELCLGNLLSYQTIENKNIMYFFQFHLPNQLYLLGSNYICNDGHIKEYKSPLEQDCFYVCDRQKAMSLQLDFTNAINNFLEKNGLWPLEKHHHLITIELKRTGKPSHLFTRSEIEELMRNADDRVCNQLVIDENGYAQIVNNISEGFLYPVRHESWDAGNLYVGKYSQLKTLDEIYIMSLQGWLLYLKTGKEQSMDYIHENINEEQLIEDIKSFY